MAFRTHGLAALRAFAMVAGCDYDTKVAGLGPAAAMGLVKAHGVDVAVIAQAIADKDILDEAAAALLPSRFAHGVSCFLNPIVYDLITHQQRCLSGAQLGQEQLARQGVLDNAVDPGDAEDGGGRSRAELRSLGVLNPRGERHVVDLGVISQVMRISGILGGLSFDMVPGSVLDAETAADHTVAQLTFWFKTRGVPCPPGGKADMVKAFEDRMRVEAAAIALGERIRLRDPRGGYGHVTLYGMRM